MKWDLAEISIESRKCGFKAVFLTQTELLFFPTISTVR